MEWRGFHPHLCGVMLLRCFPGPVSLRGASAAAKQPFSAGSYGLIPIRAPSLRRGELPAKLSMPPARLWCPMCK
eukprot:scaffold489346_cov15-Prasinocladus_malaysianus.AAC.1